MTLHLLLGARLRPLAHKLLRSGRLALAALLLGSPAVQASELRLAVADLPQFAPALVAEAQQFFAQQGLQLRFIHCVNGKRCLQHLLDGEADLATVADTPIVMAAHAGKPFDIVATMATSVRDTQMVVRRDRGIHGADDLRGKRLGMVRGTTSHYFSDLFLLFHGIDPDALKPVPLDPQRAVQQLLQGEVDAAALYQPHVAQAQQQLGARGAVLRNPGLYTLTLNLVALPQVRDEVLVRALAALRQAITWMASQPDQGRARVAALLRVDPGLLDAAWEAMEFDLSLSQSLLTTLEAESRWALREGLVPAGTQAGFLERLRPGPLRQLEPRAVSVIK